MNGTSYCPGSARMAASSRPRFSNSGMTLLEMTVVILVLLSLIVILFIGANAWKRGSDRALCIVNLEQVQKGVRGFANLNESEPGDIVPGLEDEVIGSGKFVESLPRCPGEGSYTTMKDQVPFFGEVYLSCSLADSLDHEPVDFSQW